MSSMPGFSQTSSKVLLRMTPAGCSLRADAGGVHSTTLRPPATAALDQRNTPEISGLRALAEVSEDPVDRQVLIYEWPVQSIARGAHFDGLAGNLWRALQTRGQIGPRNSYFPSVHVQPEMLMRGLNHTHRMPCLDHHTSLRPARTYPPPLPWQHEYAVVRLPRSSRNGNVSFSETVSLAFDSTGIWLHPAPHTA